MSNKLPKDEELRFIHEHIARQNALGDALIILARLEATTFDPMDKSKLVIERRRIEDDYAANEQEFLAYFDGKIAINPPTQEQVDSIVKVAGEVAQLTQKKTTATAVIKLATSITNQVTKIRDGL